MREYVRIGSPEQVVEFRQSWIERGKEFVGQARPPHTVDLANDPFFGRGGKLSVNSQREQA